ncbi:MAG: hypothetical protein WAO19_07165, partial [Candidatus Kryptoniota bacterium]
AEIIIAFVPFDVLGQSVDSNYQATGDEFGHGESEGYSDFQFGLLWSAYNLESDSILAKFFTNWELETRIAEEPLLETPISNATASLFDFLLDADFQSSNYPYEDAVIQNQIEATMPPSLWSSQDECILQNYHPQSSDPYHPVFIILDDSHNEMLEEFLGDWSEVKTIAAQEFFGNYVPFGVDVDYSNNQNDWALIRHWYTFSFTPDLQQASVLDQTPSGAVTYACIVGPDGNWVKFPDQPIAPLLSRSESPPVYSPHPAHHPLPVTIVHDPSLSIGPAGDPRSISTTTHPASPRNRIQAGRPRPIAPRQHNPTSPQIPTQPKRSRDNTPSTNGPTSPRTPATRSRQSQQQVNTPSSPNNPATTQSPSHATSSKSQPPDTKTQDPKKDHQKSQ